jgi:hypothetical protein
LHEKTERFLRYNFKELLQKNESASFNKAVYDSKKILLRQTASHIISVKDNSGIVFDRTIIAILNDSSVIESDYLVCILNSKYYKYLYTQKVLEAGKVFPQVKLAYLKDLPFPVAPKEAQKPFIAHAQKMLTLTKQLNETRTAFIDYFRGKFALQKITRNLENWHTLEFADFIKELAKQKVSLSSTDEFDFKPLFDREKKACVELQAQITQTDTEIDKMVYALYGLSEEEIRVVDGLI